MKFYSPSKYFREVFTNNREPYEPLSGVGSDEAVMRNTASRQLVYSSNTVSIKEGDELLVTCTVNSSKPAALLSLWLMKRHHSSAHHSQPQRRQRQRELNGKETDVALTDPDATDDDSVGEFDSDDARRLDIIDSYAIKNTDLTLKTVSTSKFVVSRAHNYQLVACVAENPSLNEKWETKRILNVLCKCGSIERISTVYVSLHVVVKTAPSAASTRRRSTTRASTKRSISSAT